MDSAIESVVIALQGLHGRRGGTGGIVLFADSDLEGRAEQVPHLTITVQGADPCGFKLSGSQSTFTGVWARSPVVACSGLLTRQPLRSAICPKIVSVRL